MTDNYCIYRIFGLSPLCTEVFRADLIPFFKKLLFSCGFILKFNKVLQIIKRAHYFIDSVGGYMRVNLGSFAGTVPQQSLDVTQIGALFQ